MNPCSAPDLFDGQPHYSERLRADFDVLAQAPDAVQCHAWAEEAAGVLAGVLALEEHTGARGEDDKEPSPDLIRLERKLDLILELLALQQRAQNEGLEARVQFSAAGARWQVHGACPSPGAMVMARLHVHRLLPTPLRLPAEVLPDEPGWLRLRFLPLGETCEELLLRFVFQQHRRQLAGSRRASRGA